MNLRAAQGCSDRPEIFFITNQRIGVSTEGDVEFPSAILSIQPVEACAIQVNEPGGSGRGCARRGLPDLVEIALAVPSFMQPQTPQHAIDIIPHTEVSAYQIRVDVREPGAAG